MNIFADELMKREEVIEQIERNLFAKERRLKVLPWVVIPLILVVAYFLK